MPRKYFGIGPWLALGSHASGSASSYDDICIVLQKKESPLHVACDKQNIEVVQKLINRGAEVNCVDTVRSHLSSAMCVCV